MCCRHLVKNRDKGFICCFFSFLVSNFKFLPRKPSVFSHVVRESKSFVAVFWFSCCLIVLLHWLMYRSVAPCELEGYGSPCRMLFQSQGQWCHGFPYPALLLFCPQKLHLKGPSASAAMLLWTEDVVLLKV